MLKQIRWCIQHGTVTRRSVQAPSCLTSLRCLLLPACGHKTGLQSSGWTSCQDTRLHQNAGTCVDSICVNVSVVSGRSRSKVVGKEANELCLLHSVRTGARVLPIAHKHRGCPSRKRPQVRIARFVYMVALPAFIYSHLRHHTRAIAQVCEFGCAVCEGTLLVK